EMKQMPILLLSFIFLLNGCASTEKIVLDNTKRPPTTNVDVYKPGEKPNRPFKEVAKLSFLGPRQDEFKALRHFVSQAKKIGANGLLVEKTEEGGMKGHFGAFGGGFGTEFVFKSTAIVYE